MKEGFGLEFERLKAEYTEKRERFSHLHLQKRDIEGRINSVKRHYYREIGRLEYEYEQWKSDNDRLESAIRLKMDCRERTQEEIEQILSEETEKQKERLSELKARIAADTDITVQDVMDPDMLKEAKRLYRKLAARLHPDLYADGEEPELFKELWIELQNAYNAGYMIDMNSLMNIELCIEEFDRTAARKDTQASEPIEEKFILLKAIIERFDKAIENLLIEIRTLEDSIYLTEIIYLVDNPDRIQELKGELSCLIETEKERAKRIQSEYLDLF